MEKTKRHFNGLKFVIAVVAVAMAILLGLEAPLTVFAETIKDKYISEVIMLTASNLDDAKKKAEKASSDAGKTYYVFESPIYECGSVHTYIAYTTTNKPSKAIKAIKTMNMRGGWSYQKYNEYLQQLSDQANKLGKDLYEAIKEFSDNLSANKKGTEYAKQLLDFLCDDDTHMTLSDLFVELAKEDNYEAVKGTMIKLIMESNKNIISTVESALTLACADSYLGQSENDTSFLTGMERERFMEGLDGFIDNSEYSQFDVYVNDILATLDTTQSDIRFYENSNHLYTEEMEEMAAMQEEEITIRMGEFTDKNSDEFFKKYNEAKDAVRAEAAADDNPFDLSEEDFETAKKLLNYENYYKGLSADEQKQYTNGRLFYVNLSECAYTGYADNQGKREYDSLLDLIMKYDVTIESEKAKYKNTDFYPLINMLSPGQRALLKVGFSQLIISVTTPADLSKGMLYGMLDAANEAADEDADKIKEGQSVSIYTGVDRSLFKENSGVALTSDAIRKAQEKPFGRVITTADKINKVCNILAIATGGIATVGLATSLGLSYAVYSQAKQQALNLATKIFHQIGLDETMELFALPGEWITNTTTVTNTILGDVMVKTSVKSLGDMSFGYPTLENVNKFVTTTVSAGTKEFTAEGTVSFAKSMRVFFASVGGQILSWINAVSIGITIIVLVVKILAPYIAPEKDAPYVDIPRVMCSYEEIFGQTKVEGKDPESDYIYYYGVKNPFITDVDQTRASAAEKTDKDFYILRYMVGDIANWTLKGESREWVALFTSTDKKSGNPILANSLTIVSDTKEFNNDLIAVKKFGSTSPFDLHAYYGITINKNVPERYLGFKQEAASDNTTASVFSNATLWGGLIAGVVIGGAVGVLVSYAAFGKRKKARKTEA